MCIKNKDYDVCEYRGGGSLMFRPLEHKAGGGGVLGKDLMGNAVDNNLSKHVSCFLLFSCPMSDLATSTY